MRDKKLGRKKPHLNQLARSALEKVGQEVSESHPAVVQLVLWGLDELTKDGVEAGSWNPLAHSHQLREQFDLMLVWDQENVLRVLVNPEEEESLSQASRRLASQLQGSSPRELAAELIDRAYHNLIEIVPTLRGRVM